MSGLVLELQKDALDKTIDASELLRKAMVVSKKLGITEIEEWISRELSGYPANDELVPAYREVSGMVKVYNHIIVGNRFILEILNSERSFLKERFHKQ